MSAPPEPGTRVWLDDLRPAPEGWVRARSAREAIALLCEGRVDHVSLDHDLGEYAIDGGDGAAVTDWMAEHDTWPDGGVRVHSANPIGVAAMLATVDRYSPYPLGYSTSRGSAPAEGWPVARC